MEKTAGLVREGMLRLPPGFRFHPTDEELVVQYLKRKAFCCPLPAAIIPDIQLSGYDPWDLPGSPEGERYFFSTREARRTKGSRHGWASAAGYWKATGRDRRVVASGGNQLVGMKKTLVFYCGKAPNGSRTDWVMHEYRLSGADPCCVFPQRKNSTQSSMSMAGVDDWVLCRIFRRRTPARDGVGREARSPPSATPSDSGSSCLTEASDGCGSGEDTSRCSSASSSPHTG